MPDATVVVAHGGFGTTQAALAAAVPQVVLPLFSCDQFSTPNGPQLSGSAWPYRWDGDGPARRRSPSSSSADDRPSWQRRPHRDDETLFAGRAGALAEEMVQLPDVGACVTSLDALRG